jgi:hypothetical protein
MLKKFSTTQPVNKVIACHHIQDMNASEELEKEVV